tara:strand:- start:371 stop:676 length:306 start_codon:yes stop_codon:yes gene_type:complete
MDKIIKAIKAIKSSKPFKTIRLVNKANKNGDKFIALIGINHIFSEMQLKSDDLFADLYKAVSELDGVEASFTSPSENTQKPGTGLLYIGKSVDVNVDDLSL